MICTVEEGSGNKGRGGESKGYHQTEEENTDAVVEEKDEKNNKEMMHAVKRSKRGKERSCRYDEDDDGAVALLLQKCLMLMSCSAVEKCFHERCRCQLSRQSQD